MIVDDKEVKQLYNKRRQLMFDLEDKKITKNQYDKQYEELTMLWRKKTKEFLTKKQAEGESVKEEKPIEEPKMPEEKVEKGKRRGKNPDSNSYTGLIIKALGMKSIKTVDAAVDKVDEWKPGRDKKKIRTQVNSIISLVKKQKEARWKEYSWDAENFMLTEKEE